MTGDARAPELARVAAGLAAGAGIELPDGLALWGLAGGRPAAVEPLPSGDPGQELGAALERALNADERRRGAHYTPVAVADEVARRALGDAIGRPRVVDPACGGGALLLAAGRRLARAGVPTAVVARELLWGADVAPLAAAVTEASVALWSGGTAPAPGHVVVADLLADARAAWAAAPQEGFDVVVGNPPFQGQLARSTARSSAAAERLRARFGTVVAPYVDTAALFLLVGVELAGAGGRVALVQPQSVVASRDAGPVRAALAERARLVDLWAPPGQPFHARVHVCVPVLEVGASGPAPDWSGRLAAARGTPVVDLAGSGTVADLATAVAGFRDEYYGLAGHVREGDRSPVAPLVTSGLIDIGAMAWGKVPVRFAKRSWQRPEVDVDALRSANPRVAAWVDRVRRPKVVVASQTRTVEAAADRSGSWVPCTPVISVLPRDPAHVDLIAAVLCAPPISAWAARRSAGTALSARAMRMSAPLVLTMPLPADRAAWEEAAALLARGDVHGYAASATAMYRLSQRAARAALVWWHAQAKPTWPPVTELR